MFAQIILRESRRRKGCRASATEADKPARAPAQILIYHCGPLLTIARLCDIIKPHYPKLLYEVIYHEF